MSQAITINKENVIYEIIDGEGILLDIQHGNYYSLNIVAADIWVLIEGNYTADQINTAIADHYRTPADTIRSDIQNFIETLQTEALIHLSNTIASNGAQTNPPKLQGSEYEAPQIDIYTDLQDLLMIDPIHEVDYTGWPTKDPAKQ